MISYRAIIKSLQGLTNPKAIAGMARYGIIPEQTYGVSIPNLRKLARQIGTDHRLAGQLWRSNCRETRILATMIDDAEAVTEGQMEKWVSCFDYWEICDQCCMNLFEKTKLAYKKCHQWSSRSEEFVKRAGFTLMARLAVSDKKARDTSFVKFFPLIIKQSRDERNYVKKAVNWALRQIGKRNRNLNKLAIETAREIRKIDNKAARWIASDALRELTDKKVQQRLNK